MQPNASKVGILGTGTMGTGIVQVAAQSGFTVVACDHAVEALERAQLYVRDGLSRFASKGVIAEKEAETAAGLSAFQLSLPLGSHPASALRDGFPAEAFSSAAERRSGSTCRQAKAKPERA